MIMSVVPHINMVYHLLALENVFSKMFIIFSFNFPVKIYF